MANPNPNGLDPEDCARGGENAYSDVCRSCGGSTLGSDGCSFCDAFDEWEGKLGD